MVTLGNFLHPVKKKPEEVEEEMESEGLPTIISDSKNRVRLANAAYNEMVGQPELPWLESVDSPYLKRISGEVKLDFSDSTTLALITSSNGFSCRVKNVVSTPCDVIRLHCICMKYYRILLFMDLFGHIEMIKCVEREKRSEGLNVCFYHAKI